jgi:hypothetical protein
MAALHSLQDQIVAGLKRKVEVRHQPLVTGNQFQQGGIDLDTVERRETKPHEGWDCFEKPLAKLTKADAIAIVAREVDAREHNLLRASFKFALDRLANCVERKGPAGAPSLPDRAEGAAMVATVLDRNEASDVTKEASWNDLRLASICTEDSDLVIVSDHAIHFRHSRERPGIELRRAACHEDADVRALAPFLPDRLPRLPDCLVRHRAAVDDHPIIIGRG